MSPRIERHADALEVGAIPILHRGRTLRQCGKAFRTRRITAGVDVEKVKRGTEAFNLELRGLHPRLAEITEHARPKWLSPR
jgi:hypothetical protein